MNKLPQECIEVIKKHTNFGGYNIPYEEGMKNGAIEALTSTEIYTKAGLVGLDEFEYWVKRCEAAELYIEETPCDPDIYDSQIKAFDKWQELVKNNPTQLNPIPITPEILEKCGFVMLHHLGRLQPTLWINSEINIYFEFDGSNPICVLSVSVENTDEDIDLAIIVSETSLRHIQYLHQLQNLVFILSGEELVFK